MATDKITQKEVIDNKVITTFEDLNKVLEQSIKNMTALTTASIELQKNFNPNDIQTLSNAQNEYNTIAAKSSEENKKAATNLEKLREKIKEVNEEEERAKIALQAKRKEIKDRIKAEQEQKRSTESLMTVLKQSAKTEKEATEQNKKLLAIRKQLDVTTTKGAKSVDLINKTIDKNNDLLKNNASQLGKQKMNVGAYKESITDALKEQEVFGISINKVSGMLKSGAGIFGALTAVLVGLGKAYASSARGAEDMARASDRLNTIAKSLGNSLADVGGEAGIFEGVVRNLQQQIFGLAKTIEADLQVGILATIRQLEILEADQERQKKSQLDRAEQLRQIRDEERNSFAERKAANDELASVIAQREEETIAFQQQKLSNYQTLLSLDEGNLEIQRAIKQVEFEIADAREEAQGFRSEQLANDLALSKEYYANELELQSLIIQGEIAGNQERYNLRKQLIDITKDLELEAAGENEQLRQIAIQKAKNAEAELTRFVKSNVDQRLQYEIDAFAAKQDLDTEKLEHDIEKWDEDFERYMEQEEQLTDLQINENIKRLQDFIQNIETRKWTWREYVNFATAQAQQLTSSIVSYMTQELDHQQTMDIERARSRGASEEEISKIEKKYAEKRKNIALTQAIINTALAVTNALTVQPFILGLVMAVLAAAAGAIEIATISSAKFAKGTKDSGSKGQIAWVGEEGTERINLASGESYLTPNKATLTYLPAHSEVVPNPQLQRELAELQSAGRTKENRNEGTNLNEIVKAIKKRDETYINITENGVSVTAKRGNDFYKYIDRKYRR